MLKNLSNILLAFSFLLFGCKSQEEIQVNESLSVDADMIKNIDMETDQFTEYVDDQIDTVSVEIIAATRNRTIQRSAVEMKKFFNKRLHKYENIEDPRKAFLNSWSLVYRFKDYISKGDGKSLFGEQQPMLDKSLENVLFHFENTAQKHLSKKQLSRITKDLKKYSEEYPIKGYYQDAPEITSSVFTNFLSIPMAPFKAVNAINKGGESIESISKTVARFTDIAEDLPDEIRWQLQVLAVQLQQNDILKTNTESFQTLAQTSAQLVKIVDQYPDRVSDKVKKAAKDLEKTITQLNTLSKQVDTSMSKLQASSENFKKFGDDVNQSTEKITESLQQVEKSSQALTKAAEAVSVAMKDIQAFSTYINESSEKNPREKDQDPFLVQVEKSSTALAKSAEEIRKTLEKVMELSDKKLFNDELSVIDKKAHDTVTMTREESQTLVDYAFKKALLLIVAIFLLAMIVTITKGRMAKSA